jgi:hypothetical protein
MKKLLFVLALAFTGQQAFSQIYIMTYTRVDGSHPSGCSPTSSCVLTKIDPAGNVTYTCLDNRDLDEDPQTFVTINIEINAIINQGYKLIGTNFGGSTQTGDQGSNITDGLEHNEYTSWYFAIP